MDTITERRGDLELRLKPISKQERPVVKALASRQSGLGLDPRFTIKGKLSLLLVLIPAGRALFQVPRFPSLFQNQHVLNSNLI